MRREDARDTINSQRQREAKLHEQVRMAEENEAAMADELKVTTNHLPPPLSSLHTTAPPSRRFALPPFFDLNVVVLTEPRDVYIFIRGEFAGVLDSSDGN